MFLPKFGRTRPLYKIKSRGIISHCGEEVLPKVQSLNAGRFVQFAQGKGKRSNRKSNRLVSGEKW